MIGNDGTSESRKIFGSILTSGMTNSKRGAYATTTKAQKPITTVGVPVFKTDSPPGSYGVSRVITRKL